MVHSALHLILNALDPDLSFGAKPAEPASDYNFLCLNYSVLKEDVVLHVGI